MAQQNSGRTGQEERDKINRMAVICLLVLLFVLPLARSDPPGSSPAPTSSLPAPSDNSTTLDHTTQSSTSTQSQLIKPPAEDGGGGQGKGTTATMRKVARQTPPAAEATNAPFGALKPESKDELFARIDEDKDNSISLEDYMKRDRFYVESVRQEFSDIDTNRDGTVTKAEFDAFVQRLDEQRKAAMMEASKFTLQKNDMNKDGELTVDELGTYINGTLQRSVAHLPDVFKQYDRNGNQRLDLDEFHELDFNFPWEKFPPSEVPSAMALPNRQVFLQPFSPDQLNPPPGHQVLFNGGAAPQPPPFMAEQSAPIPVPNPMVLPQPQPVRFSRRWAW